MRTVFLLIVGCSSTPPTKPAPPPPPPKVQCDAHASADTHFTDATHAWNLDDAVGTHLTTADLDGDGFPDLIAESVDWNLFTTRPQKNATPKLVRVLMNRPGSGHRVFVDATDESGIFEPRGGSTTEYRAAELHVAGDVDNDGDVDLFSGKYWSSDGDTGDRPEVLLNDGKGHFKLAPISDVTPPSSTTNWPMTTATFVDVDRDGTLDLFVAFWYENYANNVGAPWGLQAQLYRGNGDGTFKIATSDHGLKTLSGGASSDRSHRPAYGVQACDLDNDGAPELLVAAYGRQWNHLWHNDGAGNFEEVGRASGYAGDSITNFHDNEMYRCYCTAHSGEPYCANAAPPIVICPNPPASQWFLGFSDALSQANGNSYSTSCADFDGDGDLDLYSGTIRHWWAGASSDPSQLLRNEFLETGNMQFTRISQQDSGMIWPHGPDWNEGGLYTAAADFDNDAREDVLVGATAYDDQFSLVFHQTPDHHFEEVGAPWGLHHACAEGMAVADFDRDGDLDVVLGSGTARGCAAIHKTHELKLYESDASEHGGWIEVHLVGNPANRSAIGARVTVHAGGTAITKDLGSGYGYYSIQNDPQLFFGLGACKAFDSIDVRWPDANGSVESHSGESAGRVIELRQGDAH